MTQHVKINRPRPFIVAFDVTSAQSAFPFEGPFWEHDDLLVFVITDGEAAPETWCDLLDRGTQLASNAYTVTGLFIQGGGPVVGGYGSGIVNLNTAVTDCMVVVDRFIVDDRDSDFNQTAPLSQNAINSDLDRLTARDQDIIWRIGDCSAAAAPVEGGDGVGFEGVAFRCGLYNDVVIPIGNGYGGNGGWYISYDTTAFDTHSGLDLALDAGTLANATAQMSYYAASTAYVVPVAGVYEFDVQIYLSGANENAVFQLGFSHHQPDGDNIWDDPSGQDMTTNSPTINLAPATGAFDNGVSFTHRAMIACALGDIIRPWFIRAPTTSAVTLVGYSTWFAGKRVAPSPA